MQRHGLISRYYQYAVGKLTNPLVTEIEILTLLIIKHASAFLS
jgi:hypothetical protein